MVVTLRSFTRLWALLLAVAALGVASPVYASSPQVQYQPPARVDAPDAGVIPDGADLLSSLAVDDQDDDRGEDNIGRKQQAAGCIHSSATHTHLVPDSRPATPLCRAGAELPATSIYLVTARLRL